MKDFFEMLNTLGKPKRSDIIEKDFHLHRLLHMISQDDYLSGSLTFKGGTCLVKAYLGFYRFSEDIDFTWQSDDLWKGRTVAETRRLCSEEITTLAGHFRVMADTLGMNFSGDKTIAGEVHISSGGRMVLFFIGYQSEILNMPSSIKVEINFVDKTLYPFKDRELRSYVENVESEELEFLYEKLWNEYNTEIQLGCYDPREIYVEKCRASLTRMAYKLRDVIDILFMEEEFGYSVNEYKEQIEEKVRFMLELYERYRENIELMRFPPADILGSEEMKLFLIEPPKDLGLEVLRIHSELDDIRKELTA
ncbi:MAG: nucleotidyl transferase AbiEii/AbiGii toxin family protein [Candidatus Thermoplasmatota archaeon]|nr:nucleotidyl transferase AbiEii/AbiGii toxin family protein [Candidatus Thermoplasmatota archaeon]